MTVRRHGSWEGASPLCVADLRNRRTVPFSGTQRWGLVAESTVKRTRDTREPWLVRLSGWDMARAQERVEP